MICKSTLSWHFAILYLEQKPHDVSSILVLVINGPYPFLLQIYRITQSQSDKASQTWDNMTPKSMSTWWQKVYFKWWNKSLATWNQRKLSKPWRGQNKSPQVQNRSTYQRLQSDHSKNGSNQSDHSKTASNQSNCSKQVITNQITLK